MEVCFSIWPNSLETFTKSNILITCENTHQACINQITQQRNTYYAKFPEPGLYPVTYLHILLLKETALQSLPSNLQKGRQETKM